MTLTESRERTESPSGGGTDLDEIGLRPPWPWRKKMLAALAITLALSFVWSARRTGLSPAALVDGYSDFRRLVDRMLPIEFRNFGNIVELAIETFHIAFLGTALAVLISFPLAFLAARNTTPNALVFGLARGFIVAMRAVPDLIFALIFVRAVGIGVLAGVLAIGLHAIGMIGKLFADAIEQIDEGPREAVLSAGGSRIQAIWTGVIPQVMPSFIGTTLYRLDINFRTSTILGYVGAGGIGSLLQLYLGSLQYPRALGVTAVIVVLVLAVEFLSASVRKGILGSDAYASRRISRRLLAMGPLGTWRSGRRAARAARATADGIAADETTAIGTAEGTAAMGLAADTHGTDGNGRAPVAPPRLSPPWTAQRRRMALFGWGSLVMMVVSLRSTGISLVEVFGSLGDIYEVSLRLIPRNMDWYDEFILEGIVETIAIGIAATTMGLAVAYPLAYLAARNVAPFTWVYYLARTFVVLVRAVPELIIAVLFVAAVGLGPFPGVMALAIGTVGFATKLLADAIEEVRPGPRDAIKATGASGLQEAATGVTPQAMPAFIGTSLYVLDINIRAATILGLVGAGGIGFYLIQATRTLYWERVGGILIIVFVVVYGIERLSGWVRKQLL